MQPHAYQKHKHGQRIVNRPGQPRQFRPRRESSGSCRRQSSPRWRCPTSPATPSHPAHRVIRCISPPLIPESSHQDNIFRETMVSADFEATKALASRAAHGSSMEVCQFLRSWLRPVTRKYTAYLPHHAHTHTSRYTTQSHTQKNIRTTAHITTTTHTHACMKSPDVCRGVRGNEMGGHVVCQEDVARLA